MITATIPELLDSIGFEYSWEEGRGISECPFHDGAHPKDFRFSDHIGRCSSCKWIGDQTALAKSLELYNPNEIRQWLNIADLSSSYFPKDPQVNLLDNMLTIARAEICQVIEVLEEMEQNGEMKPELFYIEYTNRWSEYLDFVEYLIDKQKAILWKGCFYGLK